MATGCPGHRRRSRLCDHPLVDDRATVLATRESARSGRVRPFRRAHVSGMGTLMVADVARSGESGDMTTSQAQKAEHLRSLHVPGNPLIVTNVWDAVTARIVAAAPGVKALATASHSISFAHGVPDGEGLTVAQAVEAARTVRDAVPGRMVPPAPGVKALATASHSIWFAHGVPDGEGLTVAQAVEAARTVINATDLPVSVDFEKGYSPDGSLIEENVGRLI